MWQMVTGSSSTHTACGKFLLLLRGLTTKLITPTSAPSLQKEVKRFVNLIVKWPREITFLLDYMIFLNIAVFQVIDIIDQPLKLSSCKFRILFQLLHDNTSLHFGFNCCHCHSIRHNNNKEQYNNLLWENTLNNS